ncbi:MAG: MFS transporter [Cellulosilyticaceae bacterium]
MEKNEGILTETDYTHAQNCFIGEAICGNLLIKLTQGVFVTGFSKYIGLSDSLTGIIASIPVLVGFLQIVGGLYFQNTKERKRKVTLMMLLSRIFLGLGYIIPVVFVGTGGGKFIFIGLYTLGYLMVSLIGPVIVSWVFEMCPKNRSQYLSRREMIVMIVLGILEIPLGYSLDLFKDWQKEGLGFIVFGILTIIFGIINLMLLRSIKERPRNPEREKKELIETLKEVLNNKSFRKLAVLFGGWNMGIYFGNAYLFVYLLSKLEISYLFITCSGMICLAIRTLTVKRWAKLIDKKSWSYVARIGILIMAIATGLQAFLIRRTVYWLLPVIYLLSGTAWGAVAMTFFNLQVMFVPEEEQTKYIGVFASINGISGFTGTLIAATCIKLLKPYAIEFFGVTIANIQMIFIVSAFILLSCFIYTKWRIEPLEQKKKEQSIKG